MKETTRDNIVRYAISAAFVLTVLIVGSLMCIGLDWITDKTGWPLLPSFCIICFVYLVWRVGKGITVSDEEEQVVKLEPSKDLEKEIQEVQRNYKTIEEYKGYPCTMYADDIEWIARHFFELGLKARKGE